MPALSPLVLLLVCWGLTVAVACLALAAPEAFDLVPVFMARHDLDPAAFTGLGALWHVTALSWRPVPPCPAASRPAACQTCRAPRG